MMINPKEGVLYRIEQSFEVLFKNKNSFLNIFLPYFFYKFIFVIIIGNIFYFGFMNFFDFENLTNSSDFSGIVSDLFGNTQFIIGVNIFLIFFLINLMLVIPFILATYKTIKETFEEKENINYLDNIKYGFKSLGDSFKTYWYMFVYVALYPLLLLIAGGLLFIFAELQNIDELLQIGIFISLFGFIIFVIFAIYRGLKTVFSIVSAVDYNEYTKDNFENSVNITNNNWWRIIGNFLLISIIISLIFSIINGLIGMLRFSVSDIDYMGIISGLNGNIDENKINSIVEGFTDNIGVFSLKDILFEILDLILDVLKIIFIFIFTYIFYKRLELESLYVNEKLNKNIKNIEL